MMRKNGITDLSAIVQSYNFGRAYLRWLASNKKQHSLPVAICILKRLLQHHLEIQQVPWFDIVIQLLWHTMVATDIKRREFLLR